VITYEVSKSTWVISFNTLYTQLQRMSTSKIKGLIIETDSLRNIQPMINIGGVAGLTAFNTPLISFPLSFILRRGVSDITFALTERSINVAYELFGNGNQFNANIEYKIVKDESFLAKEVLENKEKYRGSKLLFISANTVLWGRELRENTDELINGDYSDATIFGKRIEAEHSYETMLIDHWHKIIAFQTCEGENNTCQAIPKAGFYPEDLVDVLESLSENFIYKSNHPINSTYLALDRLDHIYIHSNELWYQIDNCQDLISLSKKLQETIKTKRTLIGSPELSAFLSGLITKSKFLDIIEIYSGSEHYDLLIQNMEK
jgi:dTDP-glucose pyrophosphorylase